MEARSTTAGEAEAEVDTADVPSEHPRNTMDFSLDQLALLDEQLAELEEKAGRLRQRRADLVAKIRETCGHSGAVYAVRRLGGSYDGEAWYETRCGVCGVDLERVDVEWGYESGFPALKLPEWFARRRSAGLLLVVGEWGEAKLP